ncbi:MAG: VTT domain-containing protein [Sphaerochaetaceae bacterium]|nr:VTT domain-containing protein [Sphaerochaetaceae bacterium]
MDNATELKPQGTRQFGPVAVALIVLAVVGLFSFFLIDIMIPFIRLQSAKDVEGAAQLLKDRGWKGFLAVSLVEALQMLVVFIPAEFIQISSGLSYPFYMALILCDFGVCLGATIIFVLVRVFHVISGAAERNRKKIDRISANMHDRNTVFLIYLLFFMPLVPFGAICYYGSGTKLPYRKYILTVATGVVPSIITSNLMGAAGRAFMSNSLPIWLLVLIIVFLAALLFLLIWFFIKNYFLKGTSGTPDSPAQSLMLFVMRLIHGRRQKVNVHDSLMESVEGPYIMLVNHESFFDFLYVSQIAHHKNPAFVMNAYYFNYGIMRKLGPEGGMIPKKLFTADMPFVVRTARTIVKGYPVVIFPEGRLSPDGRTNFLVPGAAFYQRLNVDIVLVKITGAYFANPKWRKKRFISDIDVTVEKVIKSDDAAAMDAHELDKLIAGTLYNNASENQRTLFPQRNKALGLENILYRCADCGSLYTTKGIGNDIVCTKCGSRHTLNDHYLFDDSIGSIPGYYDKIKDLERAQMDTIELKAKVRTRIFDGKTKPRNESGECLMTKDFFRYVSSSVDFTIKRGELQAIPFSCGEEFELYYNNELYYFYPDENPQQCARWALISDMLSPLESHSISD